MKFKILNIDPKDYSKEARTIVNEFAIMDELVLNRDELLNCINNYDGLITRFSHILDKEILKKASNLKVIGTATTGLNHIDVEAAQQMNIKIISLNGEREFLNNIHATAEFTWGLILSLIRKIPFATYEVLNYDWDRDLFKGTELNDHTLGIIGYGRIGSKIAKYAICFGMNVKVYDPFVKSSDLKVEFVSLENLLSSSDIITVHVPYQESTINLLGKNEFDLLKKNCYIINTSRGGIIDEDILYNYLINGGIAGAALDVVKDEYMQDKKWLKTNKLIEYSRNHHNLIITPHLGGATWESMTKTEIFIANKLKNFLIKKV
jgi:D-3-phosphoglycerate dehydrogenase